MKQDHLNDDLLIIFIEQKSAYNINIDDIIKTSKIIRPYNQRSRQVAYVFIEN